MVMKGGKNPGLSEAWQPKISHRIRKQEIQKKSSLGPWTVSIMGQDRDGSKVQR